MSMLEIEKVSKVFKSGTFGGGFKLALQQVSFGVDQGEVLSLIGESGSGKSTLGKIVLKLLPPTSGRVVFEGQDITGLKKRRLHDYYRQVQGVFQDPFSSYNPVYKADRVFEMLRQEYFSDLARDEWHAKMTSALEAVTLNPADVLDKFPHQLSGGQQQRLLVARALLLDVKLLIADEIISMLDASTRVDVLNMLVGLKKRGLGILFITHDLSLGNYISDKTVILRHGVVLEMGLTTKVFGNPQHPYTRSLLSAVPQLHKKWDAVGARAATNGNGNGHEVPSGAAVPAAGAGEDVRVREELPEGRRYSKSSLNPVRQARADVAPGDARDAGGSRPSLMDMPDGAWARRGPRRPQYGGLLADAPELVECEDGHFVAVSASR